MSGMTMKGNCRAGWVVERKLERRLGGGVEIGEQADWWRGN